MWEKIKTRIKQYAKSFTIWFNSIGIAIIGAAMADPTLQQILIDHNLVMIIAIGNIILRFKTNTALHDK